jgi:PPE-repeat protein
MKTKLLLIPICLSLFVSGCASTGKATLLGSGIGAAVGAGAGLAAYPGKKGQFTARNVIVGGALGGLLGAGAGFIAHELVEKGEREGFEKGKAESGKANSVSANLGKPTLIPAKVESRFVDDQVRGNVFVPAHVEYIIVEPARWTR